MQFNEDQSRVRSGYAANNLAIVRHIVMNLLRLNTTRKVSIKSHGIDATPRKKDSPPVEFDSQAA